MVVSVQEQHGRRERTHTRVLLPARVSHKRQQIRPRTQTKRRGPKRRSPASMGQERPARVCARNVKNEEDFLSLLISYYQKNDLIFLICLK